MGRVVVGKRRKEKAKESSDEKDGNGTRRVRQAYERPGNMRHHRNKIHAAVNQPERSMRRCGDDGKWRGKLGICKGIFSPFFLFFFF